jgi:hypothetical protein
LPPTPDQLDPDWHRYPDTVLHFRTDPPVRIDLREPVAGDAIAAMDSIGLSGPFAVLTAHDPRGRDEDADVNERRSERLDDRLLALGVEFVHVDAYSPDGSHCEASVAAIIEREQATALAREFEQVAIFWFDGEKFWIVGALAPSEPVVLPRPV